MHELELVPDWIRPISRKEFDQMVHAGIFDGTDEHVELLAGMLVTMSPHDPAPSRVVEWLTQQIILRTQGRYRIRCQLPFAASEWSEPEPDVGVFSRAQPVEDDHPSASLLLIEVSNTTLKHDRLKRVVYSAAGVPEYWIIRVKDMTVEVYADPRSDGYATCRVLRDGDVVRPTTIPDLEIAVAELPR
ncbi:MAG: Uma2 family endonuclease [Kofleriaceae bacterium]|nr:Uma2 family endonuclease [Kofleriaceae bacterium]